MSLLSDLPKLQTSSPNALLFLRPRDGVRPNPWFTGAGFGLEPFVGGKLYLVTDTDWARKLPASDWDVASFDETACFIFYAEPGRPPTCIHASSPKGSA